MFGVNQNQLVMKEINCLETSKINKITLEKVLKVLIFQLIQEGLIFLVDLNNNHLKMNFNLMDFNRNNLSMEFKISTNPLKNKYLIIILNNNKTMLFNINKIIICLINGWKNSKK